jgi:hypothetical protein
MDGFTWLVCVEAIVVYKMSTAVLSSRSLQLWITGQCALELLALARVQPCGGSLVDRHATTTCTMSIAVTDSIVTIAFSPTVRSDAFRPPQALIVIGRLNR